MAHDYKSFFLIFTSARYISFFCFSLYKIYKWSLFDRGAYSLASKWSSYNNNSGSTTSTVLMVGSKYTTYNVFTWPVLEIRVSLSLVSSHPKNDFFAFLISFVYEMYTNIKYGFLSALLQRKVRRLAFYRNVSFVRNIATHSINKVKSIKVN